MINPELKIGDRVILVYMSEEAGMHPGTKGTVTDITRDPFEGPDDKIISVDWDNGRTLGLVSITDMWMKEKKEKPITENIEDIRKIGNLVKIMNLNVVYDFFEKLRQSGLVNMLGSVAFTWSGRQYLEKFIDLEEMKGFEIDPDQKEELLEAADKIQMEIIRASMKVLEKEGKEDTIENINRTARDLGKQMLMFFINAKT